MAARWARSRPRPAPRAAESPSTTTSISSCSTAQQDLEVMHEVIDRMTIGHHGAQAAPAVDDVDRGRVADGVAAVRVDLLAGRNAVALLREVDLGARAHAAHEGGVEGGEIF